MPSLEILTTRNTEETTKRLERLLNERGFDPACDMIIAHRITRVPEQFRIANSVDGAPVFAVVNNPKLGYLNGDRGVLINNGSAVRMDSGATIQKTDEIQSFPTMSYHRAQGHFFQRVFAIAEATFSLNHVVATAKTAPYVLLIGDQVSVSCMLGRQNADWAEMLKMELNLATGEIWSITYNGDQVASTVEYDQRRGPRR